MKRRRLAGGKPLRLVKIRIAVKDRVYCPAPLIGNGSFSRQLVRRAYLYSAAVTQRAQASGYANGLMMSPTAVARAKEALIVIEAAALST